MAKEHIKRIRNSKFNRQRASTSTLRSNCSTGYMFTWGTGAAGQAEYHHILPIECLQDDCIQPDSHIEFFRNCMALTVWDINNGDNLLGLPTKFPYKGFVDNVAAVIAGLNPGLANAQAMAGGFGAVPDLPCHKREHYPAYNDGVADDLNDKVWLKLAKDQPKCRAKGTDIQGHLENASFHWRMKLLNRGKGGDSGGLGAAYCWRNRNEPECKPIWYIPFSMNPGTPERLEPPPERPVGKGVKAWFQNIFEHVF
jgi:hypothetical protein